MSINNTTWLGPPNTQEYIRQLENEIAVIKQALRELGVVI